jgi:hypothetical protein
VTLPVTENTIFSRVFRLQRVPVFQGHRLPLKGSRWDIRWLIGRRTKQTFCAIPVFRMAVMAKWFDAFGDEKILFPVRFFTARGCQ